MLARAVLLDLFRSNGFVVGRGASQNAKVSLAAARATGFTKKKNHSRVLSARLVTALAFADVSDCHRVDRDGILRFGLVGGGTHLEEVLLGVAPDLNDRLRAHVGLDLLPVAVVPVRPGRGRRVSVRARDGREVLLIDHRGSRFVMPAILFS